MSDITINPHRAHSRERAVFGVVILGLLLLLVLLNGCSDADMAKFSANGTQARVTCYSGGRVVFDDMSTGKVQNEEHSDGYYFMAASTGRLVSVNGDCIVDHRDDRPEGWRPTMP